MTRTNFKEIPFDLELAKKITNGEVKGRIVTRDGRQVRIICFDLKNPVWGIIALVLNKKNNEDVLEYQNNGCYATIGGHELDLLILLEVPTYSKDYSNFVPHKNQPCLVRDNALFKWGVAICARKDKNTGKILFYNEHGGTYTWEQILPLSNVTKYLIGTFKSYEQLCEELDKKKEKKL